MSTNPQKRPNAEDFDPGSHIGEDEVVGGPPHAHPTLHAELRGYIIGLVLATLLTLGSFWSLEEGLIYGPAIVMALIVLGLAQVGVHLVFFLHLTTAPDNTNNALALAFGVLIVSLIFFGSVWVLYNMDQHMMPVKALIQMRAG